MRITVTLDTDRPRAALIQLSEVAKMLQRYVPPEYREQVNRFAWGFGNLEPEQ